MPSFTQAIDIDADAETLFALTQDYERRLAWDPFLKEARLVGHATVPAVGVRAWCVAYTGMGMETAYVTLTPPRVAAVKMTRGPAILQSFAGSWRFEPLASGRTRVLFRYHLAARPRWLRPLLDPLLRLVFAHDTRQRLRALKRTAEQARPPAPSPNLNRRHPSLPISKHG